MGSEMCIRDSRGVNHREIRVRPQQCLTAALALPAGKGPAAPRAQQRRGKAPSHGGAPGAGWAGNEPGVSHGGTAVAGAGGGGGVEKIGG